MQTGETATTVTVKVMLTVNLLNSDEDIMLAMLIFYSREGHKCMASKCR
jgi:hypothetical protein